MPLPPLTFPARTRSGVLFFHFGAGLLAFLALVVWLAVDPGPLLHPGLYGPRAFGLLHLDVLGWISTVMFGAYLNLIPVILHPAHVSPRLAESLSGLFLGGVLALVLGFALGRGTLLTLGGLWLGLTVVAQGIHLAAAAWGATAAPTAAGERGSGAAAARGDAPARPSLRERWRRLADQPTALAFVLAPLFLGEVAVIGFLMALALGAPGSVSPRVLVAAPAHMAAGLGGWLGLTVMGAAYRLVPLFFATARGYDTPSRGSYPVGFVALGVLAAEVQVLLLTEFFQAMAVVFLMGGSLMFFWDMFRMIRHRSHRQRDPVTYLTVYAFVTVAFGLLALVASIFVPEGADLHAALVLVALYLGVFAGPSLLILGQLSRILVFLSTLDLAEWARDHGGVRKTWNLSRPLLMRAGCGLFLGGVAVVVVAILLKAAPGGAAFLGGLEVELGVIIQAVGAFLMCASLLPPFLVRRELRPDAAWLRERAVGGDDGRGA